MTDPTTNTTADEFYEEAQDNFPSKFDFEDRLVAIWPTGRTGEREGENGKPYPWIETLTLALDDGPDGDKGVGLTSDREEFLVGPAPAQAEGIQWSAAGVYSRVRPKLGKTIPDPANPTQQIPDYRPVIGRINRRKNAKKGMADSWSLGKPAEGDRAIMRQHEALIRSLTAKVAASFQEASDAEAFDA